MSNLGYSAATWKRMFREFGLILRLMRTSREQKRRYSKERVQVRNENDATSASPHFTAVTLTGVHYGMNTSEDGLLYVRLVANDDNWDVHLYKATGGGGSDEVARATNVAAEATGNLVAQNSSGLSGTVTLGASIAGETNDRHRLRVFVDWKLELLKIFPSDGTTEDDVASRAALARCLSDLADLEDQKLARLRQCFAEWALSAPDNERARLNAFLKAGETSLISDQLRDDGSRNIESIVTGILPKLRLDMEDEATGGEQDIAARTMAGSAGTFDASNTGAGSVASHTPEERAPKCTMYFHCIKGLDATGPEQFGGYLQFTDEDRRVEFTQPLTIKKNWKGPLGTGPVVLKRTRSKTGDGSNLHLAVMSDAAWDETGETINNTPSKQWWWKVVANASNWNIEFYKASTMATEDLVAKATDVATGATFTAREQNGSQLTIYGKVGSAPVDGTTGTLVLGCFVTRNADNVPDKFEIAVTVSGTPGKAQETIVEELGYHLNSDSSGSEAIPESLLIQVNTFPPFIVEDA